MDGRGHNADAAGSRIGLHCTQRKNPGDHRLGRRSTNQEGVFHGEGSVAVMTRKKLVVPSLNHEREEAAWWDKHRAQVEADLRLAMREGKTISLDDVLAKAKRAKELLPVTIRLASEDVATARQLADDKGIGYQTYIKLLDRKSTRLNSSHLVIS